MIVSRFKNNNVFPNTSFSLNQYRLRLSFPKVRSVNGSLSDPLILAFGALGAMLPFYLTRT